MNESHEVEVEQDVMKLPYHILQSMKNIEKEFSGQEPVYDLFNDTGCEGAPDTYCRGFYISTNERDATETKTKKQTQLDVLEVLKVNVGHLSGNIQNIVAGEFLQKPYTGYVSENLAIFYV